MKLSIVLALLFLMVVGVAAGATGLGWRFGQTGEAQDTQAAIQNGNYSAWKTAMEAALSEENFNQLVERHKAISEKQSAQQAPRNAISTGDYNAYVSAVKNITSAKILSEPDFAKLAEAYQANGQKTAGHMKLLTGKGVSRGLIRTHDKFGIWRA